MLKKISAMQARKKFGQMMNEVAIRGDDYVIERAGNPMVVMVPMERYYQILQSQKKANASLEEVWGEMVGVDENEIGKAIGEAVSSVRWSKSKKQ